MITSEAAHRDFRLCAEALIDRAVVTAADDRPLLEKIRRHAPALQSTFARLAGWRLLAHPDFARLVKTPARAEASHGLAWARGATDYALLAWVLWYGEHVGGRKFTVSQLAEEVRAQSASGERDREAEGDAAAVDWASREQRLAARRVFHGLEEMGVLRLEDGSVDEWADDSGKRDALYSWSPAAWRFTVGIPTDELERLAAGGPSSPAPRETPGGGEEVRLFRTLLLNPALFRRDDPEAFRILDSEEGRARVLHHVKYLTNWELEVGQEYARILRPARSDDAVQTPIPVVAGISHAVLCFCGALRERQAAGRLVPAGGDWFLIHKSSIDQDVAELQARHGARWGKGLRERAVHALADDVVAEMKAWGMLRDGGAPGEYLVLPTAARLDARYGGDTERDDDDTDAEDDA